MFLPFLKLKSWLIENEARIIKYALLIGTIVFLFFYISDRYRQSKLDALFSTLTSLEQKNAALVQKDVLHEQQTQQFLQQNEKLQHQLVVVESSLNKVMKDKKDADKKVDALGPLPPLPPLPSSSPCLPLLTEQRDIYQNRENILTDDLEKNKAANDTLSKDNSLLKDQNKLDESQIDNLSGQVKDVKELAENANKKADIAVDIANKEKSRADSEEKRKKFYRTTTVISVLVNLAKFL